MGLAGIAFIGFIGPIATTVVMREARIDQLEMYRKEDRTQHSKDINELHSFKEEVIRKYIKHLEDNQDGTDNGTK